MYQEASGSWSQTLKHQMLGSKLMQKTSDCTNQMYFVLRGIFVVNHEALRVGLAFLVLTQMNTTKCIWMSM